MKKLNFLIGEVNFENYKSVWYTTLFLREMKILNFLIREVNFENYKFHHFEKIEFPYWRGNFENYKLHHFEKIEFPY